MVASAALSRVRPWALPGSVLTHRLAGVPLIAAGTIVIARSLQAAGQVDLDHPRRLVTTGPYAASRNPMYAGWALLHLGAAVAGGSVWMLAAFAVGTGQVYRQILGEERELSSRFGDEFGRYRAAVPRYLPRRPRKGYRPAGGGPSPRGPLPRSTRRAPSRRGPSGRLTAAEANHEHPPGWPGRPADGGRHE
jgi:hypothetical protein